MTNQQNRNGQRKQSQRNGKPQQRQSNQEPQADRYDKIRYDGYSFVKDGKVIDKKPTPAREVVRRLTCDRVVELMIFDRQRTPAKTPKGNDFSIMCWSDKQQYAAWRFIAELCYGSKLPGWLHMRHKADTSVLTEFQITGIQQVFLYVVASEMQTISYKDKKDGTEKHIHRSLAAARLDTAVLPAAMVDEPDWFVEGIENALDHVETRADQYLNVAVELWLKNVRAQDLMNTKMEFKDERAALVDQQVDEKEEQKRKEAEMRRKLSEDEISDAKAQLKTALVATS
jgi:hypothetical protein